MQHRIVKNTEFCPNALMNYNYLNSFSIKCHNGVKTITILLIRWNSREFSLITDTQTLTQKW